MTNSNEMKQILLDVSKGSKIDLVEKPLIKMDIENYLVRKAVINNRSQCVFTDNTNLIAMTDAYIIINQQSDIFDDPCHEIDIEAILKEKIDMVSYFYMKDIPIFLLNYYVKQSVGNTVRHISMVQIVDETIEDIIKKDNQKKITVFISQPYTGFTEEEVFKIRKSVEDYISIIINENNELRKRFGDKLNDDTEFEFIDQYHQPEPPEGTKNVRIWYLGNSINMMANADIIIMVYCFKNTSSYKPTPACMCGVTRAEYNKKICPVCHTEVPVYDPLQNFDFIEAKGCVIEKEVAKVYGIPIVGYLYNIEGGDSIYDHI